MATFILGFNLSAYYMPFGKEKTESFKDIVEIKSGGYMVIGHSDSNELNQVGLWIVTLDERGNKLYFL